MNEPVKLISETNNKRIVRVTSSRAAFYFLILSTVILLILIGGGMRLELGYLSLYFYFGAVLGLIYGYLSIKNSSSKVLSMPVTLIILTVVSSIGFQIIGRSIQMVLLGIVPFLILKFINAQPFVIYFKITELEEYYKLEKISNYLIYESHQEWIIDYSAVVEVSVPHKNAGSAISSVFTGQKSFNSNIRFMGKVYSETIDFVSVKIRGLELLNLLVLLLPSGTHILAINLDRTTGGVFSSLEPKVSPVDTTFVIEDRSSIVSKFKQLNRIKGEKILLQSRMKISFQVILGLIYTVFFITLGIIFTLVVLMAIREHTVRVSTVFGTVFAMTLIPFGLYTYYNFVAKPITLLLGKPNFEEKDGFLLYYCQIGALKSHIYKIPVSLGPKLIYENHSYSIICETNKIPYYKLPLISTESLLTKLPVAEDSISN